MMNLMQSKELMDQLKASLHPFDLNIPSHNFPLINNYLDFYNLPHENNINHYMGTFKVENHQIVMQAFIPSVQKATVCYLHGYLDHSGMTKFLLQNLLHNQIGVLLYDLPGHGLSSGLQANIDSFTSYNIIFNSFIEKFTNDLIKPLIYVGHSTGSAILINYLLTKKSNTDDKFILLAPLIRLPFWNLLKLINRINKIDQTLIKNIPRYFRKNSSDLNYLNFVKFKDPLQSKFVSLNWINALFQWNYKLEKITKIKRIPVKIIQGNSDKTVAWRFNVRFLKKRFPEAKVKLIKGAEHNLINETISKREEVFINIVSEVRLR